MTGQPPLPLWLANPATIESLRSATAAAEQRCLDYQERGNGLHVWLEIGRAIRHRTLTGPAPLLRFLEERIVELQKLAGDPPLPKEADAAVASAVALKFPKPHPGGVFADYRRALRNRGLAQLHELDTGGDIDFATAVAANQIAPELRVEKRTRQRAHKEVTDRVRRRTSRAT